MIIGRFPGNSTVVNACRAGRSRMIAMLLTFAVVLGVSPAFAQTITGAIRGTVTDPTGAVVAGATVTATDVATGVSTSTVTDHRGDYSIQFLPIGEYTVSATKSEFSTSSIPTFGLQIDQIAKIDIKLQVGNASTTVKVSSSTSPILQTQNATLGTTISGLAMVNLPNNGLNYLFSTLFVPGAVNPSLASMAGSDGNERNSDWSGLPSFNGARGQNNDYVMDGIEINETLNNYSGYNPAPDSIQETRVVTGNADAEYGNVSGGEVLVVTRGGTNQYHGSLYEFFQNNNVGEANSYANKFSGVPLTPFTQNQFGGSVGGPILKNKLFFFGDYEGFRYHSGGQGSATVATADMRTGDFSELLTSQYGNVQLYNNQNGAGFSNATPYVNNQIPVNNPVAKFLFAPTNEDVYPLPNRAPIPGLGDLDNYVGSFKGQTLNNQGDIRVDYKIGPNDALMGRYTYGDAYDFVVKPLVPAIFPANNDYPFQSFVSSWVHTFSSSLVNEFRMGISRTVYNQNIPFDPSGVFGTGGNAKVGIPFPNQPYPGFTYMSFSSFESNFGTSGLVNLFHENNFTYGDNLTWEHGTHITKFGVQILRYQQNSFYPGNAGALGSFDYGGVYTQNPNVSQYGWGFADFALDEADGASVGGVAGPTGQRQYRNAYYVQDDWRILPNLTLNLGLRYAHDQPIYEVNNKEANLLGNFLANPNPLATGTQVIQYAGKNGASRALYNPYWWEFMPRVGFALQLSPRMVLRGAYGQTDDLEGTGTNLRLTQNPPFLHQFTNSPTPPSATSSGGAPLMVENGFNLSSGNISVNNTTFNAWFPNLRPALIQQFNLATQFLLSNHTSAQIGYVGELGQHLIVPEQLNQWPTPATGVLADGDCSGTIAAPAPFCGLVGNYGVVLATQSEGFSNYNALQATLHQMSYNGLEYTINYTWSRAMTNNAGFYGVPGVAESSSFYQNIYDPHGDYGPTGQDTRNALNATAIYSLPFGRGRKFGSDSSRLMDAVLGGWQLSGDAILYSGFPVSMYTSQNYYVNSFGAHAINFRPMHIRNRTTQHWFGTDPSAIPCLNVDSNGNTIDNKTCAYGPESYTGFGNAQNGSERAPGFRQIDLSAFKTFKIVGTQTLEVRGDAFNAFNISSYGAPDSTLTDYNTNRFGLIQSTLSTQRVIQVSMHYKF
jgi:Carboxypeptidase regulatory-like domain/TonB dependent receptor